MLRKVVSIFMLLLAVTLYAQDPEFTASAPASVQVGKQFQYTIQGDQQIGVKLPELDNSMEFVGGPFTSFSSSTQWVNGKMQATTTASYTYIIIASKSGEFSIPPATIKTKKSTYKTNEVKIVVMDKGQTGSAAASQATQVSSSGNVSPSASETTVEDSPVFLKIIPSRTSMYVGEQFVSELKIYTNVNTSPVSGIKEIPYEGFYKNTVEADQVSSRENINGEVYVTQVLQRHILIPQKAGKISIPPFESEWTIPKRVSGRGRTGDPFDDFFNDPFFDRVQNVPTSILTKPVTITVKPLPEGAPEGFSGAVGDFKMTAKLSADKVKVNDALNLTVEISGSGNLPLIGAPEVNFPPDHDVYETSKKLQDRSAGNRIAGNVIFEYPIVARHAGSFRIAPVKFSWFDPSKGEYKTLTSNEFTFVVEKGDQDEEQAQIFMPGARGESVKNIGTDILDIHRTIPPFIRVKNSPLTKTTYWLAYLVIIIIFVVIIVILNNWLKQRADIQLSRNRKANKMARNRMKSADKARKANNSELFFEETEKALWGYLSDKLSIELSSLSRDKVSSVLSGSGIEESLQDELIRLIDDCEFSRYAPSSEKSDMDVLYRSAIRLINNLEHNIRTR